MLIRLIFRLNYSISKFDFHLCDKNNHNGASPSSAATDPPQRHLKGSHQQAGVGVEGGVPENVGDFEKFS